jgi:hypothetical protein
MKKQTHTKEEKQAYFQSLRETWKARKAMSVSDDDAIRAHALSGLQVSYTSFFFTLTDMRAQGLDGIPYIDAKTFNKWIESGYQVKKGEHSTLRGIAWISTRKKEDDPKDEFVFPKEYKLFHRNQVEPIAC